MTTTVIHAYPSVPIAVAGMTIRKKNIIFINVIKIIYGRK